MFKQYLRIMTHIELLKELEVHTLVMIYKHCIRPGFRLGGNWVNGS
jgi:hypothetical protein